MQSRRFKAKLEKHVWVSTRSFFSLSYGVPLESIQNKDIGMEKMSYAPDRKKVIKSEYIHISDHTLMFSQCSAQVHCTIDNIPSRRPSDSCFGRWRDESDVDGRMIVALPALLPSRDRFDMRNASQSSPF